MDTLSPEQEALLQRAKGTVQKYLEHGKSVPVFAIALQSDGGINSLLASDEFTNPDDAFASLLNMLGLLAQDGMITTAVLVPPVLDELRDSVVLFELEQRGGSRFGVVLPYTTNDAGGIAYGAHAIREITPMLVFG